MRKLIKIGIFVGVVLIIAQITVLPLTLPEAVKLQIDVWQAPYSIRDYEEDEFDCSNMAALLTDNLDQKGWNATIRAGYGKKYGHAWVEVNGKCVESTAKLLWFSSIHDLTYPKEQEKFDNSSQSYQNDCLKYGADFAEEEWDYQKYLNRDGYG